MSRSKASEPPRLGCPQTPRPTAKPLRTGGGDGTALECVTKMKRPAAETLGLWPHCGKCFARFLGKRSHRQPGTAALLRGVSTSNSKRPWCRLRVRELHRLRTDGQCFSRANGGSTESREYRGKTFVWKETKHTHGHERRGLPPPHYDDYTADTTKVPLIGIVKECFA